MTDQHQSIQSAARRIDEMFAAPSRAIREAEAKRAADDLVAWKALPAHRRMLAVVRRFGRGCLPLALRSWLGR
jgi:hypothetical protein